MAKVQFKQRTETTLLIVHCSATKPSMDWGVREIRQSHKERGFLDIGYHYVIKRDGTIEEGRDVDSIGAHCEGKNYTSVGICLVGGVNDKMKPDANFTAEQMASLGSLRWELHTKYPNALLRAHHDFAAKACPSFDLGHWMETGELVTSDKG